MYGVSTYYIPNPLIPFCKHITLTSIISSFFANINPQRRK